QLKLDDAPSFSGTISGFDTTASIDLVDIAFSGATLGYSGIGGSGTLTVGDGTHVASLSMIGDYNVNKFRIADDGHGGILLTELPVEGGVLESAGTPVITLGHLDPASVIGTTSDPIYAPDVDTTPTILSGGNIGPASVIGATFDPVYAPDVAPPLDFHTLFFL